MELSKYKACICEGSAETAIIDIIICSYLKEMRYWMKK